MHLLLVGLLEWLFSSFQRMIAPRSVRRTHANAANTQARKLVNKLTSAALYVFVRALKTAFDAASARPWFPEKVKEQPWDVILMTIAAMQIIYGYIVRQYSLPPSYLKFLMSAGRIDKRLVFATGAVARGEHLAISELQNYAKEHKIFVNFNNISQKRPLCDLIHPGENCFEGWIRFLFSHFVNYSIRMYFPLNLITLILFQRQKLIFQPTNSLKKLIISCLRSAAFLSFYVGNGWLVGCILRSMNIFTPKTNWLFCGLAAGPAVLIEQKSRRMELALYCLSPALQSMHQCAVDFGWFPKVPNVTAFIFCLASAILMAAHQNGPENMQPLMSRVCSHRTC
jgi:hypothetical protein